MRLFTKTKWTNMDYNKKARWLIRLYKQMHLDNNPEETKKRIATHLQTLFMNRQNFLLVNGKTQWRLLRVIHDTGAFPVGEVLTLIDL